MKKIVFDSYALLAFFRDEKGREEVSRLLTEAAKGACEIFVSVVNVGEVYYISRRKDGEEKAEDALVALLSFPLEIVDADFEITMDAARLKAKHKMSYADAFAAALTQKKKGTLVTGDMEFRALEKEAGFRVKFI